MKNTVIDPTWAWTTFQPTDEQPWNRARAAHLLRRAGFGATSKEIDAAVAQGPDEIVTGLVAPDLDAEFERESDAFAMTILASGNPKQWSAWWSYGMLRSPHPLLENDIQELARCFTGWEIRRGNFRFNRFQHDTGTKSVLGHNGPLPKGQSIDVVLGQPVAPQFIVRKLFRGRESQRVFCSTRCGFRHRDR